VATQPLEGAAALGEDATGNFLSSDTGQSSATYLWRRGDTVQALTLSGEAPMDALWKELSPEEFHGIAVGLAGTVPLS